MIPNIIKFLNSHAVVPDIRPDTRLTAIKMRNGCSPGGSLVNLLFLDNAPTPRYVLRIPREPAFPERLRINIDTLTLLAQFPSLKGTAPLPIFADKVDGVVATLETYLDGASLAVELAISERRGERERFADLIGRGFDWITRLHTLTWRDPISDFVEQRLQDAQRLVGYGFLESALAETFTAYFAPLAGRSIPFALCHNDYNPNNILLPEAGNGLFVIDWEYAETNCALFDLFQLATIGYLFPGPGASRTDRLRALWNPQDPVGRAFCKALRFYATEMEMESSTVRPLFAGYLVYQLLCLHRQIGTRPDPMLRFWQDLLQSELSLTQGASPVSPCLDAEVLNLF